MNKRKLIWHLFDEGGDASGASEFMASIGMNDSDISGSADRVEYGLPEDGGADDPVGGDQNEGTSLEDEFAELIGDGGKYEELYNKRVADTIQNRFKNQTQWQNVTMAYENAVAPLFMHYGLEIGDVEGLGEAIAEDTDYFARAADESGETPERYRENLKLQLDAQRGRTMAEQFEREQRERQDWTRWQGEADELREAFPKFDLATELKVNEDFANMLHNGISVKNAFLSTHMDDILNGSQEYVQQSTRQQVAKTLTRNARRPVENGMSHSPAAVRQSDPSKLSNKDLDEILKRVQNGESFRF